jgi:hypothetical protein
MRRWLFLLSLLLCLCLPGPVQASAGISPRGASLAQEAISIQTLQIDVWPEYDRPEVLVIYHITLASTVKLPAEIVLRVPVSSGGPFAIAEQTANGLFNLEFSEIARDDQWVSVRLTTTLPQLQVEYYDAALRKDGAQRTFTYVWPGDYPVAEMLVKFQQPPSASRMTLEPNTGSAAVEQDGLTYFSIPLGQVDAGERFQIQTQYDKANDDLTQNAAFEQVTPVSPANAAAASPAFPQVLPWLLGGLGLILIGGGVFWYMRGSGFTPAPARQKRSQAAPAAPSAGAAIFCHQCGKKASGADVFCRTCGTRLRR